MSTTNTPEARPQRAGAPAFRREDPRRFLQIFVQDARVLAESRGVRFTETFEGRGPVEHDPKWIRQVLLNLVANALKFSPRDGLITLTSDLTAEAWRVAIEDDGPGVPAEQRERIFERFVRLANEHQLEDAGSGLGLAISRSIIALHRGTIRAEAGTRGTGLRVVFELPLAQTNPGPGDVPSPAPPAAVA